MVYGEPMFLTAHQQQFIKRALEALKAQTGIDARVVRGAQNKQLLQLTTPATTICLEALVNVNALAVQMLPFFGNKLQGIEQAVMVVERVNGDSAVELREKGIQFIDIAGNCYINQPPLYLFVKGNKVQGVTKAPAVNRVFKQTGLRVLYAMLCNPGFENETYRTIAAMTGVALGMVNWVFNDLNELGFLLETGTGRNKKVRLLNKEKLLERWVTAYAEQLRPKLFLGRYQGVEGWWHKAQLNPEQALWGGEPAAEILTEYLKPEIITIYADKENPAGVIIPNRLKKDPQGNVELVARFWQPETIAPHKDMVHPVLVYADLMATGNQRNIEAARMIYDQYIVQLVRED